MSISKPTLASPLYEFDLGYQVTYVNYSRANELVDAQLILTMERGHERKTFVFSQPQFNDVDRNLVSSHGVYIATIKSSPLAPNRIEVGDVDGGFAYFTARSVRNITPTA
ncbi:hypothetical protein GCM10011297_22080 [Bacterioplanes sanyensis]|jgi:hypothetical protein|uniref:hypothetical protein n=1 Tax=Bacterioplanes sanyensis TaxID=1249553 RepID=UPI00167BBE55|nr:hypothetical protein [Bacterioplanes sanyensis]GGY48646.1 hypothetical protein GCM10011297_22080 [Bacterioplanes sanyensis]